jgi:hypothetical protein
LAVVTPQNDDRVLAAVGERGHILGQLEGAQFAVKAVRLALGVDPSGLGLAQQRGGPAARQ